MCWISVCFYTNTIRINMQAVTYFWNNTTNQVAFGDQLQDQRWNWDNGKIIANFNFTLDKIPLISNSFKVMLFQEKEEFQTLFGQSCWFQYMRYEWYSFTAANCMLKKYDVST